MNTWQFDVNGIVVEFDAVEFHTAMRRIGEAMEKTHGSLVGKKVMVKVENDV